MRWLSRNRTARHCSHTRDSYSGDAAAAEIRQRGGAAEFLQADFSALQAVRALAAEVRSRHSRLDLLLNNAGGVNAERRLTTDGTEQTFAVNHLATFLLTEELRDLLVASAPARIVTVSSEAHRMLKTLDFDNLQGERRYTGFRAYATSKLANVLHTYERRFSGRYFLKEKEARSSPLSYDTEVAARLWETSAALVAAAL